MRYSVILVRVVTLVFRNPTYNPANHVEADRGAVRGEPVVRGFAFDSA